MKNRATPLLNNDQSKKSACTTYNEMLIKPPTNTLIDCRSAYQSEQTNNYHEFFSRQPCRSVTVTDTKKMDAVKYACMHESKPQPR